MGGCAGAPKEPPRGAELPGPTAPSLSEPPKPPSRPPSKRPSRAPTRPGPARPEGDVAVRTRRKAQRPPRFKVVLYNDDYTPMEFVVQLLETVFQRSPAEATQIMLHVHHNGSGVAGIYVLEVAETKVATVHKRAEEFGFPLRAGVEPE